MPVPNIGRQLSKFSNMEGISYAHTALDASETGSTASCLQIYWEPDRGRLSPLARFA